MWNSGDQYSDQHLKNKAINALVSYYLDVDYLLMSGTVRHAWDRTVPNPPLRLFLLDIFASHSLAADAFTNAWDVYPLEFLKELSNDLLHQQQGSEGRTYGCPVQRERCYYHAHGQGCPKCPEAA